MRNLMVKTAAMLALLMTITGACKRLHNFELESPPEFPWRSVNEFEFAVVYPYSALLTSAWGGAIMMTDRVIFDAMSEHVWMLPGTQENYPQKENYYWRTTQVNDRADDCFKASYKAINNINQALDFVYNKKNYVSEGQTHPFENLNAKDQANLNRQLGELHFLRAYAYFHMIMRYCPKPGSTGYASENLIPLRKEWSFDPEKMRTPELTNAKFIMDSIIRPDLHVARNLLPDKYLSTYHRSYQFGRATRMSALLLSTRVFFYLHAEAANLGFEPYDSALIFAEEIINNASAAGHDLSEPPIKAFNRSSATMAKEVLWDAAYYDRDKSGQKDATLITWNKYSAAYTTNIDTVQTAPKNISNRCSWHVYTMSMNTAKNIGWMDMADSTEFVGAHDITASAYDLRYDQLYLRVESPNPNLPPELMDTSKIIETKYTWIKRPNIWCHKYFRGAVGEYTNVPVMRLPEAYLTAAYIRYAKGDKATAATYLNAVRNRAMPNSQNYFTAGNITAKAIHVERIKELCFEGDWLHYCVGLGIGKPDADGKNIYGQSGNVVWGAGDRKFEDGYDDITDPGDRRLYWTLPIDETQFHIQK